MRKHTVRPQDVHAPPSPLLRDVHIFENGKMSAEDRARVFGGNPYYLRKIVEIATHGAIPAFFDARPAAPPPPHQEQLQHTSSMVASSQFEAEPA